MQRYYYNSIVWSYHKQGKQEWYWTLEQLNCSEIEGLKLTNGLRESVGAVGNIWAEGLDEKHEGLVGKNAGNLANFYQRK